MKKQTIFENLKIVELAGVLAGPAVGMFFAELGAKVIKVENPKTNGDVTRSWRTANEETNLQSGYYSSVNYKKKVLWADLTLTSDLEKVLQEIATADIVIANFKPSSAKKIGLDSATLQKSFPELIYAQVSGYGQADETPAFDVVLQAEAGFMYINGEAGGEAVKMPIALIDVLAAHHLKEAILIALLQKEKTGTGATVHISLYNAALASLANQATNYLMAGITPTRMGSLHPNIAPYGETFTTKDNKQIVLAVGNDKQFASLCNCLQIDALAQDALFATNSLRVTNRKILAEKLRLTFEKFDGKTILKILKTSNVPCGEIKTMPEVFSSTAAQELILSEILPSGQCTKRMATAVFDIN
jgi:crotonobetainyl-CoA:carnitine CoA-transferase CaiB-like acyl-CoA transferase